MDEQTQIGNKKIYKIAFTGPMGAGKTSAAIATTGILADLYGGDGTIAYVIAFANPLKQCSLAFHQREKNRIFLQRLGDLARRELGDDVFERIFEENVNSLITNKVPELHQNHIAIMADDLRFLGEYELVRRLGFTVIKIDAEEEIRKQRIGDTFTNIRHRSEVEMEQFDPDFVIYNNINEPQLISFEANLKEILINSGIFGV